MHRTHASWASTPTSACAAYTLLKIDANRRPALVFAKGMYPFKQGDHSCKIRLSVGTYRIETSSGHPSEFKVAPQMWNVTKQCHLRQRECQQQWNPLSSGILYGSIGFYFADIYFRYCHKCGPAFSHSTQPTFTAHALQPLLAESSRGQHHQHLDFLSYGFNKQSALFTMANWQCCMYCVPLQRDRDTGECCIWGRTRLASLYLTPITSDHPFLPPLSQPIYPSPYAIVLWLSFITHLVSSILVTHHQR